MRKPCCHALVEFILKFLNFLLTFIGVSIILYSAYMLNRWQHHHDESPPLAPSPSYNGVEIAAGGIDPLNLASSVVSLDGHRLGIGLRSLPDPWFIYAFLGIGIFACCITCIGHIAAEANSGCCLCFYALLTTIFILLEVSLVAFIALDHHWEEDLPFDPTRELDRLRTFVNNNANLCEWVGTAVVMMQVVALLFAIILRSLVHSQRADSDIDDGPAGNRNRSREPLLSPYSSQASGSSRDNSDIWSSMMREKYGLNSSRAKQALTNENTSTIA